MHLWFTELAKNLFKTLKILKLVLQSQTSVHATKFDQII